MCQRPRHGPGAHPAGVCTNSTRQLLLQRETRCRVQADCLGLNTFRGTAVALLAKGAFCTIPVFLGLKKPKMTLKVTSSEGHVVIYGLSWERQSFPLVLSTPFLLSAERSDEGGITPAARTLVHNYCPEAKGAAQSIPP